MNSEIKTTRDYILVAVVALAMLAGFIFLYRILNLPPREEVISWAQGYYATHGYLVVLIGALVEGALFINWYLPGSIVVVMGVVFSSQNGLNVFLVVGLISLGFFITSVLNYALGRFGWYHIFMKLGLEKPLDKIKEKVSHKGLSIIFTTYLHPNLGALTATSAGILKLPFKKFVLYSAVALVFWNSIWGTVAYFVGPVILEYLGTWMIVALVAVYLLYSLYNTKKKQQSHPNIP